MLRYISRKQKHCHCYNSAPSCFREKQQAGCLCYLGAAAHAGKCSQKWWSEKERGGTLLCHAKTGTKRQGTYPQPQAGRRKINGDHGGRTKAGARQRLYSAVASVLQS